VPKTNDNPFTRFRVVKSTPRIGAEILDIDLSHVDDALFSELHQAFLENQVLFFRDQKITREQQRALASRFGNLHVHPAAPHLEEDQAAFIIHTHKESKINNGGVWHTDVSCDREPPMATMLHLHVVPPLGGDTLFNSMYAAYEDLSDRMQKFLSGLVAVHDGEQVYRGRYSDRGVDDSDTEYPKSEHPIIRTHPETGRQSLYVNRIFTSHIKGMKPAESRALLAFLYDHAEQPAFQMRFKWSQNDIAFWDNRCVQHLAVWDYWPHERKGIRYTIKGDQPFHREA